jgi:hypothetical protein
MSFTVAPRVVTFVHHYHIEHILALDRDHRQEYILTMQVKLYCSLVISREVETALARA